MKIKAKYMFSPQDEFENMVPLRYESVVDAFERRIRGWFLEPIEQLIKDQNNLFVATAVECMLVEALSGFLFGVKGHTHGRHFSDFLEKRLRVNPQMAMAFYDRFRCGIVHQTNIKQKSCISNQVDDLCFQDGILFFNPRGFYGKLVRDFQIYLKQLRSNEETDKGIQCNFRMRFKCLFFHEFRQDEWLHW